MCWFDSVSIRVVEVCERSKKGRGLDDSSCNIWKYDYCFRWWWLDRWRGSLLRENFHLHLMMIKTIICCAATAAIIINFLLHHEGTHWRDRWKMVVTRWLREGHCGQVLKVVMVMMVSEVVSVRDHHACLITGGHWGDAWALIISVRLMTATASTSLWAGVWAGKWVLVL